MSGNAACRHPLGKALPCGGRAGSGAARASQAATGGALSMLRCIICSTLACTPRRTAHLLLASRFAHPPPQQAHCHKLWRGCPRGAAHAQRGAAVSESGLLSFPASGLSRRCATG